MELPKKNFDSRIIIKKKITLDTELDTKNFPRWNMNIYIRPLNGLIGSPKNEGSAIFGNYNINI